jgi:hypothetical protein
MVTKLSPNAWSDMSQLLDLHLSRSIERLKAPDVNVAGFSSEKKCLPPIAWNGENTSAANTLPNRSKGTKMANSKFRELAQTVRETRKNFDEQAEELLTEHNDLRREGEEQFALYREHHKEVRENIQAMREMMRDLDGGNNPPPEKPPAPKEEGSGDSSENFQSKLDGEH